jgi:hypothetical protein
MQGACRQSKGCSGTSHKHFLIGIFFGYSLKHEISALKSIYSYGYKQRRFTTGDSSFQHGKFAFCGHQNFDFSTFTVRFFPLPATLSQNPARGTTSERLAIPTHQPSFESV